MKLSIKSLFALLVLTLSFFTLSAQDHINIDLNKIEVDMMMNPSAYRHLLERYIDGDTTLTVNEMATVYYGQGFTVDYQPDATFPVIAEAYTNGDYATVASLCEAVVDDNPLSLDLIVMGLVGVTRDGKSTDKALGVKLQRRLDLIIDTIIASGTGTSASSPFYVASTEDLRQFLRNILGVTEIVDTSTVGSGDVEAYKVRLPGSDRDHILYFNNALQHRYDAKYKH